MITIRKSDVKFRFFTAMENMQNHDKLDILLLDYLPNMPRILMRGKVGIYFNSQVWKEVDGSFGNSAGYHQEWSGRWKNERTPIGLNENKYKFDISILTTTDDADAVKNNDPSSFVAFLSTSLYKYVLMVGDESAIEKQIEFEPIPDSRTVVWSYAINGGCFYMMDITRAFNKSEYRLMEMCEGSRREIHIKEHMLFRDGGSELIVTDKFTIYKPSAFKKNGRALLLSPEVWDRYKNCSSISTLFEDLDKIELGNGVTSMYNIMYGPFTFNVAKDLGSLIDTYSVGDIQQFIGRLPHSESRNPYTYHHDYVRKYLYGTSRSDIADMRDWSALELHATALVQLVEELGADALKHMHLQEELYLYQAAKRIADLHVSRLKGHFELRMNASVK